MILSFGIMLLFALFVFLLVLAMRMGVIVADRYRRKTAELQEGMQQRHSCHTCGMLLPNDAPEGPCPRCLFQQAIPSPWPTPPRAPAVQTGPRQGSFAAPALADLTPLFTQLEIQELLGQGGMGAVYKARHAKLDRLVALKILPSEPGQDSAFADRFTREARALAK